jgi:hypothetical protein
MNPRSLLLAALLLSASAGADTPGDLPQHIVRNIRRTVSEADAVVVATVLKAPAGGKVALKRDQAVFGELPETFELPVGAFSEFDLEPGTKLLLPLRKKAKARWACTGGYEKISDGKIREYSLESYVAVLSEHATKMQGRRKAAPAIPAAESKASTVADTSVP